MLLKDKTPEQLYEISKSQNLTALCWYYLKNQDVIINSKLEDKFQQEYAKTIYSRTQQNKIYESLTKLFDSNSIYYLPLKGLVIKDYYDIPSLRFSCDIDILIHSRDFNRARRILEADGWTTDGKINFHDIHFYKSQIHLELHFNICENMMNIDKILANVWKHTSVKNKYELQMDNTFFLYHQIAHAYYHYVHGGCGIKAVLDIRILRMKLMYDEEKLNRYLKKSGIVDFYNSILSFIGYWFENKSPNNKDLEVEKLILEGGAYGSKDNAVVPQNDSKMRHCFQQVFMSLNLIYAYYPWVDACHVLLPLYPFWRLGKTIVHRIGKNE